MRTASPIATMAVSTIPTRSGPVSVDAVLPTQILMPTVLLTVMTFARMILQRSSPVSAVVA